MNILILSKKRAAEFSWDNPWACISISSPTLSHPVISKTNLVDLLQMEFYDAEFVYPGLDPEFMFNRDHAIQILDFVDSVVDQIDLLMVHCEAGMSRSPAVGASIAKLRWDDDKVFFSKYTPNMKIYRQMMDAGMERKQQDEIHDADI